MERSVKDLRTKVDTARRHGSHAGLSIFDAEWALNKLEEFEQTSILPPIPPVPPVPPKAPKAPKGPVPPPPPIFQDDLVRVSHERDQALRGLRLAVAILKDIRDDKRADAGTIRSKAKEALKELGEP